MERVAWRTKQNLDYSHLMMYSHARSRYYLQIEDDVLTVEHFVSTILEVAESKIIDKQPDESEWFDIHFYPGGFIGVLFR